MSFHVKASMVSQVRRLRLGPNVFVWGLAVAIMLGLLLAWLPLLQALTLLLPFALLLIYIEPLAGVALMLLAAPWGALENIALGGGVLDSGQILFLVTLTLWLARNAAKGKITLHATKFIAPLVLFTGIAALSVVGAPSLLDGLIEIIKWIEIGVVSVIVIDRAPFLRRRLPKRLSSLISEGNEWRLLLLIILVAGVSQALIGIWQFGLRGSGPEHFEILGGRYFRAYGTFEQPNPFGGFMAWMTALGIGALSGEMMQLHRLRLSLTRSRLTWTAFLFLSTVATFLALLFSWSRGAWLALAVGGAGFLLVWPRRRTLGIALLAAGLLMGFAAWQTNLLPPAVLDRVTSFTADFRLGDVRGTDINDANYAVLERLAHWQAAVDMARYNLWSGVGFGNYEAAYADYALLNWPDALGHAHNYYLNLLAETGVPGLVAYLIFWVAVVWQTMRVISSSDWPARGLALGLLYVWIAMSVHHLLDKLYVNNLYLFLGAMLGVLQVLHEHTCRKV